MEKLTPKELARRREESKETSRGMVAKSAVMHFRLDPADIERLYAVAEKDRKHPGAIVREWVLERLDLETGEEPPDKYRMAFLEGEVKHLERMLSSLMYHLQVQVAVDEYSNIISIRPIPREPQPAKAVSDPGELLNQMQDPAFRQSTKKTRQ